MPKFVPVNHQFFDNWNPEMAYVLGFFSADGCLTVNPRGAHYLEFVSTDKDVLIKIRRVMKSKHSISLRKRVPNCKPAFRIQIGSKYIFQKIYELGFTVNKSLTMQFPQVPPILLSQYVRGYFDGDGCISQSIYPRKDRGNRLHTVTLSRFTCGSRQFLEDLHFQLHTLNVVERGGIFIKSRGGFDLQFSFRDTIRLGKWMYKKSRGLYLDRKYKKFRIVMGA